MKRNSLLGFGSLSFAVLLALAGGAGGHVPALPGKHEGNGAAVPGHAEPAGGHADEVKLTAEAVRANGITTASALKKIVRATFVTPGRVSFNGEAMAHVGAPVKGRVVELKARIGQTVGKGDVLFVVESVELGEAQSELIQKKAGAGVAESAVTPAKESYERAKKLFEENQGISLAEVQKRQGDWVAAQGAVKTAAAAVAAAENRLQLLGMEQKAIEALVSGGKIAPRYSVVAPIAGQVIERDVTQGELVSPERDSLLVLADMSVVWVWADVPEARLAEVAEGSVAAVFTVGAKEPLAGKVTHIAPQLDVGTRTAKARIEIANGEGKLRPGMFARVELEVSGKENGEAVVVVPEGAVQMVEGKTAVFVPVEGEPHTFAKREVTVGKVVGGVVAVHAGLKEGEAYVVTGSFILKADLGKSGAAHEH